VGGYNFNYAWDTLQLPSSAILNLLPANGAARAAVYVKRLLLLGGSSQTFNIQGNGCNIYYDPAQPENAYLNNQSWPMAGSGAIMPIGLDLAPRLTSVARQTNGSITINGQGIRYLSYTIQASTNLFNWTTLISTSADISGLITFNDTAATNYPMRFYRLR